MNASVRRVLLLLWAGSLTVSGIDWAASGWSDPQLQFRSWTSLAGPLLLLAGLSLRHAASVKLWISTTATAVGVLGALAHDEVHAGRPDSPVLPDIGATVAPATPTPHALCRLPVGCDNSGGNDHQGPETVNSNI